MHHIKEDARRYFQPTQLGIATPRGTEAMLHGACTAVTSIGQDPSYGMLSVDLSNDFNLVDRQSILAGVQHTFPSLLPWTQYCYGNDPRALWCYKTTINSVKGVQQGDPLGPLLFSAALHPVIQEIHSLFASSPTTAADPLNM